MQIFCYDCGKVVSTHVPEDTVIRGATQCPECIDVGKGDVLRTMQREQVAWVKHNFGEREAWQPLLGVAEEVGELSHAYLKRHQGIRMQEGHDEAIVDAVADIVIFLSDFCSSEGIDLADAVELTWEKVRQRDWKADPGTSHIEAEAK